MPSLIEIQSIGGHLGFSVDFYTGRALLRANTKLLPVVGIALEEIKEDKDALCPGMVLMSAEWERVYFVNIRESWGIDQYFHLASQLLERPRRRRG